VLAVVVACAAIDAWVGGAVDVLAASIGGVAHGS